jgi:hypothetical protein
VARDVFFTAPALMSLPMPMPGSALSFAITVRLRLPWRTSSSTRRSGVPTPMNPPIITVAPSGIIATASFKRMVFIGRSSLRRPAARCRGSAPRRRAQEERRGADLSGVANSSDGCFSPSSFIFAASGERFSRAARSSICFCTSGVSTQPGRSRCR